MSTKVRRRAGLNWGVARRIRTLRGVSGWLRDYTLRWPAVVRCNVRGKIIYYLRLFARLSRSAQRHMPTGHVRQPLL